ncbi:MAG TPA: hypothetical protein VFB63_28725 [Bryobacteraceae bacterium]|jgi:hypothetical protein|nr:hypothetical protein [Bryobacteraceae bacterium]
MNVKSRLLPGLLLATAAIAAAVLAPVPVAGQAEKESFTGFAINMNSGPSTAVVDFTIERWSTDAERQRLLSLIKPERDAYEANQELQRVLQSLPKVGYIRTPDRLAWDLRYARQSPLDEGGRRIVLATDRPIGFQEARNQTRSMEYPFTIIEMQLDRSDRGVGKILAGTKLFIDKQNNLVLENFGQQPIRFNEIKKVK